MENDALLQNAESKIQSWTKMPKIDFLHSVVYFLLHMAYKIFMLNCKQSLAG